MTLFRKMWDAFGDSMKSISGMVSHTKISSYFILLSILTSALTFIIIEIGNAKLQWHKGQIYEIPLNHIGLFAMMLSHHLILLGLKNSNDKIIAGAITLNGDSVDNADNAEKKKKKEEDVEYPEA